MPCWKLKREENGARPKWERKEKKETFGGEKYIAKEKKRIELLRRLFPD